ncbi:MAG: peroxiredoxin [Candidatus Manganitrophaceae bacterium]|nr:MAG: peroxiredoxin [Candidatus Manganitrophaceae bacterium]
MASSQKTNTPAAEFTLPNAEGQPVRLSDYRGKNVVLSFYPADWSPVCTSELSLIQETLDDIRGYNAEVVAVSVDNTYSHRAWAEKQRLSFPLLSDFWPHGAVARQYGVFRENDGISERALFFIDASGMLRDSWVSKDPAIPPGLNIIFDGLERIEGTPQKEASNA